MAQKKSPAGRQSRKAAEAEKFEARTERSPLGVVQPDTDAEFTAEGGIPSGEETSSHYVERIGHAEHADGRKTGEKPATRRTR